MSVLVHLSDLHFGRVDDRLLAPLLDAVRAAKPDVVVISGDLTQRARQSEFMAARAFIDRLPTPRVVVPGNHDVPLYNVFRRFLRPLERFRAFIEPDLQPRHIDAHIAVVGVNTARSMVVKNGRINGEQIDAIRATFSALPAEVLRVVVTHHPFDAGSGMDADERVGRAALAMRAFADCGVDLLLSGHLHLAYSGASDPSTSSSQRYGALVVSAGTATSTRVRGEPNEFNVIRASKQRIDVEMHAWEPTLAAFVRSGLSSFEHTGEGWRGALRA